MLAGLLLAYLSRPVLMECCNVAIMARLLIARLSGAVMLLCFNVVMLLCCNVG